MCSYGKCEAFYLAFMAFPSETDKNLLETAVFPYIFYYVLVPPSTVWIWELYKIISLLFQVQRMAACMQKSEVLPLPSSSFLYLYKNRKIFLQDRPVVPQELN